ncbi:Cof-type HAD-IIB family hydrolase [Metabacillus arenae]|uniref:HAD family phosphatase n=1 Tax=Metabacillus arenae TaxID=2771434 RepID=A0A926NK40_9BACI|nr:Cof-type HAD-IIB family hydrolase [Metabacillus arenae]MBD1382230.1 HAD family phosphatase [Metabacillus arenae]
MKLFAIDLDGTLLSSKVEVSSENNAAIREAQEAGHKIMICSGRAPEDISNILEQEKLDCPVAGSNGTVVWVDGKELSTISLDKKDAADVSKQLDELSIPYRVYTNKGIYIPFSWMDRMTSAIDQNPIIKETVSAEELKRMTEQPKETDTVKLFDSIEELLNDESLTIQKFFTLTINAEVKKQLAGKLQEISGIAITSSGLFNIEVMDINGHKGNGLKTVASYFDIPLTDTLAIGDNFNDIPMLEQAAFSIAMGNADPKVKELCDAVTLTNDENGVAHAIHKYLLEK